MSSVSKSRTRSKDRKTSGAVKEQLKHSVKPALSTSGGNGTSSGVSSATIVTFHRPDNAVDGFGRAVAGGHPRAVDDCDAHSGSSGTGPEYDSISNNGSYSGESEDMKEKTVSNIVDFEKREKIRLRNEKKHQRQRERRAQELHERCCSFLMSRKLESLSRQLVAMGFTSERATEALMMNDGKLEESVSWLLEGNTVANKKDINLVGGCSLKIDITDELAQVAEMETRLNCSKKEVERAVVSSEGDLQKAEEIVRTQKQELLLSSNRSDETNNNNTAPPSGKSVVLDAMQQRKSERDLIHPNTVQVNATHLESVSKYQVLLRENRANGVSDGSWQPPVTSLPTNTFAPSASVFLRPTTNIVDARRRESGPVANNVQQTLVREPLVVMQRPQSISAKQVLQSTAVSTPGRVTGSYPVSTPGYEALISNGNGQPNQNLTSMGDRNVHPQQSHYRADYRQQDLSDASRMQLGSFGSRHVMTPSSPPLNATSSLGLFLHRGTGGHSGASSHVDWNHVDWYTQGQMPLCDYTSIDWTMDLSPMSKSHSAQWVGLGLSSIWKNHSTNRDSLSGFSEGLMAGRDVAVSSHEWTSPFGGKDIFCAPRQFVNSSSLW